MNPLGPPEGVRAALAAFDPASQPDPQCRALREALATHLGVSSSRVWAGEKLLPALAKATLRPGHRALLFAPCPRGYEQAVLAAEAGAIEFEAQPNNDWSWDIRRVGRLLRGLGVTYACLGQPNDPTGAYLGPNEVARLAKVLAPAFLILDERLLPFAERPWESLPLLEDHPNLVLLRSLSVAYGLGSLELEYVVAEPDLVHRLTAVPPAKPATAAAAEVAGLAALREPGHVERGRTLARRGAEVLRSGSLGLGLTVVSAPGCYVLVRTGDGAKTAQGLLDAGYRVLDCTPLGLRRDIRIAPRTPAQCRSLLEALRRLQAKG